MSVPVSEDYERVAAEAGRQAVEAAFETRTRRMVPPADHPCLVDESRYFNQATPNGTMRVTVTVFAEMVDGAVTDSA